VRLSRTRGNSQGTQRTRVAQTRLDVMGTHHPRRIGLAIGLALVTIVVGLCDQGRRVDFARHSAFHLAMRRRYARRYDLVPYHDVQAGVRAGLPPVSLLHTGDRDEPNMGVERRPHSGSVLCSGERLREPSC